MYSIYSKVLRTLRCIKHHCLDFLDINCLKVLYCALIPSLLEFGSIEWDISQVELIEDKIDKVHRRFMRMIVFNLGMQNIVL